MLAYGYSSARPESDSRRDDRRSRRGLFGGAGAVALACRAHAVPLEIVWVRLLHSGHQSRRWLGKIIVDFIKNR